MDPEATLQLVKNAIDNKQWPDAVEALNNYYQWRVKGGFEPQGGDVRADRLSRRMLELTDDTLSIRDLVVLRKAAKSVTLMRSCALQSIREIGDMSPDNPVREVVLSHYVQAIAALLGPQDFTDA